jgi:hypothetical protein
MNVRRRIFIRLTVYRVRGFPSVPVSQILLQRGRQELAHRVEFTIRPMSAAGRTGRSHSDRSVAIGPSRLSATRCRSLSEAQRTLDGGPRSVLPNSDIGGPIC